MNAIEQLRAELDEIRNVISEYDPRGRPDNYAERLRDMLRSPDATERRAIEILRDFFGGSFKVDAATAMQALISESMDVTEALSRATSNSTDQSSA